MSLAALCGASSPAVRAVGGAPAEALLPLGALWQSHASWHHGYSSSFRKSSKYWKTSGYIKRRQKDQYRIRNSLYYEKKWIIVVGQEDWKTSPNGFWRLENQKVCVKEPRVYTIIKIKKTHPFFLLIGYLLKAVLMHFTDSEFWSDLLLYGLVWCQTELKIMDLSNKSLKLLP